MTFIFTFKSIACHIRWVIVTHVRGCIQETNERCSIRIMVALRDTQPKCACVWLDGWLTILNQPASQLARLPAHLLHLCGWVGCLRGGCDML